MEHHMHKGIHCGVCQTVKYYENQKFPVVGKWLKTMAHWHYLKIYLWAPGWLSR